MKNLCVKVKYIRYWGELLPAITVIKKSQCAMFALISEKLYLTEVSPTSNSSPEDTRGCEIGKATPDKSVADGTVHSTTALKLIKSVVTIWSLGQSDIIGGVVSSGIKLNITMH